MSAKSYRMNVASTLQSMGKAQPMSKPAGVSDVGDDETAEAASGTKLEKGAAGYREARCCERCHFFIASGVEDSGTCQIVSGSIDGDWICDNFRAKTSERGSASMLMMGSWG